MYVHLGSVRTYAVLYIVGMVAHLVIALALARRVGCRWHIAVAISVSYVVAMTTGARVLYDMLHGIRIEPFELFTLRYYDKGGLWGGPLVHLTLATIGIVLLVRRRGPAFDLVALSMPIPMAVIKLGCFCDGCCFGAATGLPWAVAFPRGVPEGVPTGVPLHRVQLYEVLLLVGIMVVLVRLRAPRWRGRRLLAFLALYGLGRGLLDFLRGDAVDRTALGPFTLSQLVCLAVGCVGAGAWLWYQPGSRAAETPGLPEAPLPTTET